MSESVAGNGWLYDLYTPSSQEYLLGRLSKVGDKRVMQDGREFVFVSTVVDCVAGDVLAAAVAPAEVAGTFTAALVGDEKLVMVKSGVTVNQYAGGYIIITESSGAKTSYGIVRNSAAGTGNAVTLYLDNPIVAAIAAADDFILVPSRYEKVIMGTATCSPVGVALRASTAATNSTTNYMWIQTKGVGAVRVAESDNITIGVSVMVGAAGTVIPATGLLPVVGTALGAAIVSDGDSAPVYIHIA